MHQRAAALTTFMAVLTVAACGGDSKEKADPKANVSNTAAVSPEDYRKAQQKYADSVLNAARTTKEVVTKLGKGYEVGSVRLRDSLSTLAAKTNCFPDGRKSDPYLAGTVSFFVFMGPVGSNVVRVQEDATSWSSPAGNIVTSCLNLEAKTWKFDVSFGKPGALITQVQFK